MKNILHTFFNKGHQRTVLAKKNIVASFGIKGVLLLIGFVKVPIFLDYIGVDRYGLVVTVLSIVAWINVFDFGLGHGLRNRLAISLAKGSIDDSRKLVSTAYISIFFLVVIFFLILFPISYFIDWNSFLKYDDINNSELHLIISIVLITFLLRFVLNLISSVFKAHQMPALGDIFLPLGAILSLTTIILLKKYAEVSILYAVLSSTIPTLIVALTVNIFFFSTRYKYIRPSFSYFDRSKLKDIMGLGIKFFYLQLMGMVMYSFANVFILRLAGPEEVTVYSIANKLFVTGSVFFGFIIVPYWTGFTDAYSKGDFEWIKSSVRTLLRLTYVFSAGLLIFAIFSSFIFDLWIGDRVVIPFKLVVSIAILQSLIAFYKVYGTFINGVGKLKINMISITFSVILFIPIVIYLTKQYGAMGYVLTLLIVNYIPLYILNRRQYKLIIFQKAKGIWNQ